LGDIALPEKRALVRIKAAGEKVERDPAEPDHLHRDIVSGLCSVCFRAWDSRNTLVTSDLSNIDRAAGPVPGKVNGIFGKGLTRVGSAQIGNVWSQLPGELLLGAIRRALALRRFDLISAHLEPALARINRTSSSGSARRQNRKIAGA
jgi:hypothetical protein